MTTLSILIFSTQPVASLHHLLQRILGDLPDVAIGGIVQEESEPSSGLRRWARQLARCGVNGFRQAGSAAVRALLNWFHAAGDIGNSGVNTLQELQQFCAASNLPFRVHSKPASGDDEVVLRVPHVDLGVIYGNLPPGQHLSAVPRLGFITVTQRSVAEQQENRPEGREQILVEVHRAANDGKLLGLVAEQSFAVEPYDTAKTIDLKSRLLGIDSLIEVLRAECSGQPLPIREWSGRPMTTLSLNGSTQRARRSRYKVGRDRPWYKLAARLVAYPALRWRNRRRAREKSFPVIVLFHHVVTDRPKELGISTEQFWKQIRFLKRHYRIAALPEAIEMLQRNEVAVPTVVLTFDDGYEDNFLCLRAVAEAENVPVTFFVCAKHISERTGFRHDLQRGEEGFLPLSWDQVRYFDRHGFTIGSHTRTHFDCGSDNEPVLQEEMAGSLEDLRRELGRDVSYFSFPWGKPRNMSSAALAIARNNYAYSFSACGGVNRPPLTPGTPLNRNCHPDSLFELELLMQSLVETTQKT